MFTQAGLRVDDAVVTQIKAVVRRRGRRWKRGACMVRWPGCQEVAWVGVGGISWPEQLVFVNLIDGPDGFALDFPRSRLP